ncbi:MAG: hypothetical protein U1E47_06560 [Rivihabitans pingtungensis]
MAVFDIDDAHIDACERLGALAQVSHCYHRPRQPGWPYNLFAMCHGDTATPCAPTSPCCANNWAYACWGTTCCFRRRC